MGLNDSRWNISVSSLVILAASVFKISSGKTDKHGLQHYPATTVGVDNERWTTSLYDRQGNCNVCRSGHASQVQQGEVNWYCILSSQWQELNLANVVSATLVYLPGTVFRLICISMTLKTCQECTFWACLFTTFFGASGRFAQRRPKNSIKIVLYCNCTAYTWVYERERLHAPRLPPSSPWMLLLQLFPLISCCNTNDLVFSSFLHSFIQNPRFTPKPSHNLLLTLAESSGKRNVTVWRPSVRLSVPSAYSPWLTMGAASDSASVQFGPTTKMTDILVSVCF